MASLVRGIEDLVVEDREVEGKAETDGVGRGKLRLGNLGGSLVGVERLVGRILARVADGELGEVAVVVTLPVSCVRSATHGNGDATSQLVADMRGAIRDKAFYVHLVVEHLGLSRRRGRNQVLVENLENVIADLGKFRLDLDAVLLDQADLRRVALRLFLLLDRSDDPPRGTAGANDVLVGDGQEVALLDGEVPVLRSDDLHVLDHLCRRAQHVISHRVASDGRRGK